MMTPPPPALQCPLQHAVPPTPHSDPQKAALQMLELAQRCGLKIVIVIHLETLLFRERLFQYPLVWYPLKPQTDYTTERDRGRPAPASEQVS